MPGLLFPRDAFPEPAQIHAALPGMLANLYPWVRAKLDQVPWQLLAAVGPGGRSRDAPGGMAAPAAEPEERGRQLGEEVAKRAETVAPGKAVPAAQHLGPVVAVQAAVSLPVPRHLSSSSFSSSSSSSCRAWPGAGGPKTNLQPLGTSGQALGRPQQALCWGESGPKKPGPPCRCPHGVLLSPP